MIFSAKKPNSLLVKLTQNLNIETLLQEADQMNLRSRLFGLAFLLIFAGLSHGDFVINVGNHSLLPNTPNQPIDVYLTSNSMADPAVSGMNFRATLGDGSGNQGKFTGTQGTLDGVTFTGGGYFWDVSASTPIGQAPVVGGPAFADTSINFSTPQTFGLTTSRIATIKVDTTGLFSGTYGIDLLDIANVGLGATQLLLPNPSSAVASPGPGIFQISNGTFQITAVPEPASLLTAMVLAMPGVFHRGRRSRMLKEVA